MNVYEMEGFLRGKCMPRDILVNESTSEYLVRKLNEAESLKADRDAQQKRADALLASCGLYREAISKACRLINVDEMGDADDVLAKAERELLNTSAALAAIEARGEARGVEKAIDLLLNKFSGTGHIGVPVMALESLAIELREAK